MNITEQGNQFLKQFFFFKINLEGKLIKLMTKLERYFFYLTVHAKQLCGPPKIKTNFRNIKVFTKSQILNVK